MSLWNTRYCKKCGRPYDYMNCPYCEKERREAKKNGK